MSMVGSEPDLKEDVFNQMLATLEADILLMTQRIINMISMQYGWVSAQSRHCHVICYVNDACLEY